MVNQKKLMFYAEPMRKLAFETGDELSRFKNKQIGSKRFCGCSYI